MFFSHALRVGLDLWGVSPSYRGDVAHQIATRGRGDRVGTGSCGAAVPFLRRADEDCAGYGKRQTTSEEMQLAPRSCCRSGTSRNYPPGTSGISWSLNSISNWRKGNAAQEESQ